MKIIILIYILVLNSIVAQSNDYLTILDSTKIDGYMLNDFYPNPFSPVSFIEFQIADTSEIFLSISDTCYQRIDTLYYGSLAPGKYRYNFIEVLDKYRTKEKVFLGYFNLESKNIRKGFFKKENYFRSSKSFFWIY